MNASSGIAPDLDQANAEYDRLKPLRELEAMARGGEPDSRIMIVVPIVVTLCAGVIVTLSFGPGQTGALLSVISAIFSWESYWQKTRSDQNRWNMVTKTLRTFADDVNKLRNAKS